MTAIALFNPALTLDGKPHSAAVVRIDTDGSLKVRSTIVARVVQLFRRNKTVTFDVRPSAEPISAENPAYVGTCRTSRRGQWTIDGSITRTTTA